MRISHLIAYNTNSIHGNVWYNAENDKPKNWRGNHGGTRAQAACRARVSRGVGFWLCPHGSKGERVISAGLL